MGILPTIAGAVGNFLESLVPASHGTYTAARPTAPAILTGVPAQYQNAVYQAAQHTGIPAQRLADQFTAENGGKWNPALRGMADPTDLGVTQMNPIAVKTITGAQPHGINYFKNNYGREFNPTDPSDQILGSGVYLNYLRQSALPAAGITSPTDDQVMTAYNTGAQGLANAQNGVAPAVNRMRTYQSLLGRTGALNQ